MSTSDSPSLPLAPAAQSPSQSRTLRRLFLTLFLRGRSSRGLKKQTAPKSIGKKLGLTLFVYAVVGCFSATFFGKSVFALAVYLHTMTFVFLGMFVAASSGEVLFNDQEADILLHRPIGSRTLLWAKVRVLIEVSLWLAGAINLIGLFAGMAASDGDWRFPIVHALSTVLEALFCTGCVIMVYQLCLRHFGRERLEGLMTISQVLVSIATVLIGQLPQFMIRLRGTMQFTGTSWWIALLPPAWFAGLDDALAGSAARGSWILAGLALAATALVVWIAFGKLSHDYGAGLQKMGQAVTPRALKTGRRRWLDVIVGLPPLRWWLRDSVARASFLLTAAYMARDRDVKLRVYPAMAIYLVLPFLILARNLGTDSAQTGDTGGGFGIAFSAAYLSLIPMLTLGLLQYSQQWQASDIFRAAPMHGPASLCDGARRAVLCFVAVPGIVAQALIVWLLSHHQIAPMLMLLPGIIVLPVFSLLPGLVGKAVPFTLPTEEAKSAGRGLKIFAAIFVAMAISGLAVWARYGGWFGWFLLVEMILSVSVYVIMRRSLAGAAWPAME